jgi:hypothetical protein
MPWMRWTGLEREHGRHERHFEDKSLKGQHPIKHETNGCKSDMSVGCLRSQKGGRGLRGWQSGAVGTLTVVYGDGTVPCIATTTEFYCEHEALHRRWVCGVWYVALGSGGAVASPFSMWWSQCWRRRWSML